MNFDLYINKLFIKLEKNKTMIIETTKQKEILTWKKYCQKIEKIRPALCFSPMLTFFYSSKFFFLFNLDSKIFLSF